MCSKKLKAALPLWLPFYEDENELLLPDVKQKLLAMSPATIDRLLKPSRAIYKKGRCSTKPGTLLKNQIPIKTHNLDVTKPGFFEADTVAHCGNSMAGNFVFSLTFTDIFSGWTENRAVWGRGSQGVLCQITNIEEGIVFPIFGFDCDNGSEFLNYHLVRYFLSVTRLRCSSPGQDLIGKTTTPLWSRKTGPMSASCLAMIVSIILNSSRLSTTSI
jgi:hypothetical protein